MKIEITGRFPLSASPIGGNRLMTVRMTSDDIPSGMAEIYINDTRPEDLDRPSDGATIVISCQDLYALGQMAMTHINGK